MNILPTFIYNSFLQLANGEVPYHLAAGDEGGAPEGVQVEGGEEAVGEAEEHHGWDPAAGVLEREAALGHLVLLHGSPAQVVYRPGGEDLGLVVARCVGPLLPCQDVEVVVRGMSTGVSFRAHGCAEDDEVFGNACLKGEFGVRP